MRVLVIHDRYHGAEHDGESNVVRRERDLLQARRVEIQSLELADGLWLMVTAHPPFAISHGRT